MSYILKGPSLELRDISLVLLSRTEGARILSVHAMDISNRSAARSTVADVSPHVFFVNRNLPRGMGPILRVVLRPVTQFVRHQVLFDRKRAVTDVALVRQRVRA